MAEHISIQIRKEDELIYVDLKASHYISAMSCEADIRRVAAMLYPGDARIATAGGEADLSPAGNNWHEAVLRFAVHRT